MRFSFILGVLCVLGAVAVSILMFVEPNKEVKEKTPSLVSFSGKIDALYWHGKKRFTVATVEEGKLILKELPNAGHIAKNVYMDAVEGEQGTYDCRYEWSEWIEWIGAQKGGECNIHIHSLDSMRTADWNKGKFGSGSTVRMDK